MMPIVFTETMDYVIDKLQIFSRCNNYGFTYTVTVTPLDNLIICKFIKLSTGEGFRYSFTSNKIHSVKHLDLYIESITKTVAEAFGDNALM